MLIIDQSIAIIYLTNQEYSILIVYALYYIEDKTSQNGAGEKLSSMGALHPTIGQCSL